MNACMEYNAFNTLLGMKWMHSYNACFECIAWNYMNACMEYNAGNALLRMIWMPAYNVML